MRGSFSLRLIGVVLIAARSLVAVPATAPSTQPGDAWHDKSLDDVKAAANKNDADAQFELSERYAAGQGMTADAAESLKWLRNSAQAGSAPAEWMLAQKLRDGDGAPKDTAAATGLFRKLAIQRVAQAQEELASLSPEALESIAQPLRITAGQPDPNQAGAIVKVQGKVESGAKDWTMQVGTAKPADITVEAPDTGADKVKPGVVAIVWGRLEDSGKIKGYACEIPPPSVDFSYSLQNAGASSSHSQQFIVAGTVRNTGQQPVKSVTLHITLTEQGTKLHTEKTVTVKDLKPGESKKFTADLTIEQHGRGRVAGQPQVEIKAGEIE